METTEIKNFNKPYKNIVAIDCRHIGDDNDYSCFLNGAVYELWLSGYKDRALQLYNTDPMSIKSHTKESFEISMQEKQKFLDEQKKQHEASYKRYVD